MEVKFKRLCAEAKMPARAHLTDAGYDLTATSCVFDRQGNATYGTGIAVEIPKGYVGLLFPRSSVAGKDLTMANSVGVIDSGYRGEIMVKFKPALLYIDRGSTGHSIDDYEGSDQTDLRTQQVTFHGRDRHYPDVGEGCLPFPPRVYAIGERVAQIIIMPVPDITFTETDELGTSDRNSGGFGSTGK